MCITIITASASSVKPAAECIIPYKQTTGVQNKQTRENCFKKLLKLASRGYGKECLTPKIFCSFRSNRLEFRTEILPTFRHLKSSYAHTIRLCFATALTNH